MGKTHAVREAARRALSEKGLRVHVQVINGGELAAEGNSTDVVGAVREAFLVANGATFVGGGYDASLLFFDEMDALCPAADAGASGVS